jgi:hypothetical protein
MQPQLRVILPSMVEWLCSFAVSWGFACFTPKSGGKPVLHDRVALKFW